MVESWGVDGIGTWVAYDRVTGELVGRGGASRSMIADADHVEIGWSFREVFWGRGTSHSIRVRSAAPS
jgi:ribosomal-protein-alanine N-acetyltransferase